MSLGISYAGYRTGFPGRVWHAMEDGTPFEEWDFSGSPAPGDYPPAHYVGAGTFYPIGLSLHEVAKLFWRVKIYDFYSDVSFTHFPSSSIVDASISGVRAVGGGVATAHETKLIASFVPGSILIDPPLNAFNPPDVLLYAEIFYESSIYPYTHAVRFWDGKYWPAINIYLEADDTIIVYGANTFTQCDLSGSSWMGELAATVDFFGHSLNLYGASDLTASGSITVDSTNWWGYGGKFSTTTGARL